jgi:hypothetical protein
MNRGVDQLDEEMSRFIAGIDDTEDPRKAWAAVKQRIEALRTAGHVVPDVLTKVEHQLMTECMAESQGR